MNAVRDAPHRARSASGLTSALALVLIAVAAVLLGVEGDRPTVAGSSLSTGPEGRRAAFLALRSLGFAPEAFDRTPSELPRAAALLVLARRPELSGSIPAPGEERGDRSELDDRLARTLHGAHFYRRFVDEGGVLLAPASAEVLAWLAEDWDLARLPVDEILEPEDSARDVAAVFARPGLAALAGGPAPAAVPESTPADAPSVDDRARAPHSARVPFAVAWDGVRPFARSAVARDEVLLELASGEPAAVRLTLGRGALVLLPDVDFLANEALGEADHGLLLVRLIETVAPSERLLFDEYALGGWRPPGPLAVAFSPRTRGAAWHLAALALATLWALAWVREFARDPLAIEPRSALVRAQAEASLMQRARAQRRPRPWPPARGSR